MKHQKFPKQSRRERETLRDQVNSLPSTTLHISEEARKVLKETRTRFGLPNLSSAFNQLVMANAEMNRLSAEIDRLSKRVAELERGVEKHLDVCGSGAKGLSEILGRNG